MTDYARQHHDLTIVINTCDAYRDVLEIFFHAFRDFWPNCPYPIVVNTESDTYAPLARVHVYRGNTGKDDWGDRLRSTLGSIQTDFVLMLYDDFILEGPVDNSCIEEALLLLRGRANAVVTYIVDSSQPLVATDNDSLFIRLKDGIDYQLNSAPGIWRRLALIDYTVAGDTPWAWEVFGSYRSWGDGNVFYALNPRKKDIYPYDYSKGGAIYRGKWVREVVDKVKHKYPLGIDWNQRGYSSEGEFEKRTFVWKLRFMQTGFRMVGLKAFYFVASYIRAKLHVR